MKEEQKIWINRLNKNVSTAPKCPLCNEIKWEPNNINEVLALNNLEYCCNNCGYVLIIRKLT